MKRFEYLRPETIDEAISLLEGYGECACYIAGGTDIMTKIKQEKLSPEYLVSLRKISELAELRYDQATGELAIGALVTHRTLERSPVIRERFPVIHDAVSNIGSVQIRNVATIGGNICNAVPSADGAIPLITLDAVVWLRGPKGQRSLPLLDFFLGPGQTILEHGELLTRLSIPPLLPNTGSAYCKHGRREAMELPILGVAVLLSVEDDLVTCRKARIGLGVAAPTPMRAFGAEGLLEGRQLSESLLDKVGEAASEEARVRDSIRGVAWYRREMIRVLVRRMGMRCLERIRARKESAADIDG